VSHLCTCASNQAVLEDEKITAFVISRIEAEKDSATDDIKVCVFLCLCCSHCSSYNRHVNRIECHRSDDIPEVLAHLFMLQVKIAKRPLDNYESLEFPTGEIPVGVENIGRGAKWIKGEQ